jgi:hypothetical protein
MTDLGYKQPRHTIIIRKETRKSLEPWRKSVQDKVDIIVTTSGSGTITRKATVGVIPRCF